MTWGANCMKPPMSQNSFYKFIENADDPETTCAKHSTEIICHVVCTGAKFTKFLRLIHASCHGSICCTNDDNRSPGRHPVTPTRQVSGWFLVVSQRNVQAWQYSTCYQSSPITVKITNQSETSPAVGWKPKRPSGVELYMRNDVDVQWYIWLVSNMQTTEYATATNTTKHVRYSRITRGKIHLFYYISNTMTMKLRLLKKWRVRWKNRITGATSSSSATTLKRFDIKIMLTQHSNEPSLVTRELHGDGVYGSTVVTAGTPQLCEETSR